MSTTIRVRSGDAYVSGGELGDRRLVIAVTDSDGGRDLTGVDLLFMVKRHAYDDDADALISNVPDLDADPATGLAYISLDPGDTAALAGRFPWELQATDSGGPLTLASGYFYVTADLIEG